MRSHTASHYFGAAAPLAVKLHAFTLNVDRPLACTKDHPSHAHHRRRRAAFEHELVDRALHFRQAVALYPNALAYHAARPRRRVFSDAPHLGPLDPLNTDNLRILDRSIDDPVGFWVWCQSFYRFLGPFEAPEEVVYE